MFLHSMNRAKILTSPPFWQLTKKRKTPWVDSARAGCPGFLVLGAAPRRSKRLALAFALHFQRLSVHALRVR